MNIASFIQRGLTIAQRLSVAGPVVITRDVATVVSPTTDESLGIVASTYTVPNAAIESITPDAPASDTIAPNKTLRCTLPSLACAFPPAFGMRARVNGETYRILKADPIAPNGVDVVAYEIEVAK